MKYTIETNENGYTETLVFAGKTYKKEHFGDGGSTETEDKDFCDQMEADGIQGNTLLDLVYDIVDGSFLGFDMLRLSEYEWD